MAVKALSFGEVERVRRIRVVTRVLATGETLDLFEISSLKELADDAIIDILREARFAYNRYGVVDQIDPRDYVSHIFLTRITFRSLELIPVEEWFSVRCTPYEAVPHDIDDINYIDVGDVVRRPLAQVFPGALFGEDQTWRSKCVSLSRICGIPPRLCGEGRGAAKYVSSHLQHTRAAFVAVMDHYLSLCAEHRSYISGIFRPELVERSLTFRSLDSSKILPSFTEARMVVPYLGTLRISSRSTKFQHPGYFLDVPALARCLISLHEERVLSHASLVLGGVSSLMDLFSLRDDHRHAHIRAKNLVPLLMAEGLLPESTITGDDLRAIISRDVPDGPRLYLMHVPEFHQSVREAARQLFVY